MSRKRKTGAQRPTGQLLPRDMDKPAQIWMAKTARKEYWRVQGWLGLDDLLQDGAMCWQIVLRTYPDVHCPKRLMGLFKTTYTNHLHKLSNRKTNTPESTVAMDDYTMACIEDTARADQLLDDHHAELMTFLAEAPPPLKQLLHAIDANPALLHRPIPRNRYGRRVSTNCWLCSLIGMNPETIDLATMLHTYLGKA